jgi:NADH:ubiquinone oxidoreductase subunit K
MNAGPSHFAILSALVFCVGLFGVIAHVNALRAIIAVAVLFAAPVIALVGFAQTGLGGAEPPAGDAFAVLALLAVTAEALTASAVAILLWRRSGSADIDDPFGDDPI